MRACKDQDYVYMLRIEAVPERFSLRIDLVFTRIPSLRETYESYPQPKVNRNHSTTAIPQRVNAV